ncbi:FecR domain-containing protein [Tepidamorphus sp. 3E244]|uniref:FecR family protein n=1 Tax=Tepidamorphus sp. 3E244 TaxID=3385498 RepID=UPI0038FC7D5C
MTFKTFTAALLSAFVSVGLTVPSALAAPVGTTTAYQTNIVRNNAGTLGVGAPVYLGDNLNSNQTGLGMIVFEDESSAKIGPNSSLTIDEFVYSPGSRQGQIGISLDSGLARFYGGKISKGGTMQVTTPHMVLGARGGIIEIVVIGSTTIAILRAGRMVCEVNGKRQVVTNPGYGCTAENGQLNVGYGGLDPFPILDSLDEIAGTGVPGSPGGGIDVSTFCASDIGNTVSACKSVDGGLPGYTIEFPDQGGSNPPADSGNYDDDDVVITGPGFSVDDK